MARCPLRPWLSWVSASSCASSVRATAGSSSGIDVRSVRKSACALLLSGASARARPSSRSASLRLVAASSEARAVCCDDSVRRSSEIAIAFEEALEGVVEVSRAAEALRGSEARRALADGDELRRGASRRESLAKACLSERGRRDALVDGAPGVEALEGEDLEQDDAERIDVRRDARVPVNLLGRDVPGSPRASCPAPCAGPSPRCAGRPRARGRRGRARPRPSRSPNRARTPRPRRRA